MEREKRRVMFRKRTESREKRRSKGKKTVYINFRIDVEERIS